MSGIRQLFLLDQQLHRLNSELPAETRRSEICDTFSRTEAWFLTRRDHFCTQLQGQSPQNRIGLVCDAGLGKTTNMEFIQARLAGPIGNQLPVLIRLDTLGPEDERSHLLKEHCCGLNLFEQELISPDGEYLLNWIAQELYTNGATGDKLKRLAALKRLQAQGRVTLLIDGLDHAISNVSIRTHLKRFLKSAQWQRCPICIAGRPTAFASLWKNLFCESRWQYYRVAPLEENEIRFYLKQCAGGDWYPQMQSSHSLLAIPRFLRLICGLIHRATTGKDGEKARQIAVENLRVTTPAEVYCKAFFETGDEWDADSDPDTLGLLAQGLNDKAARIGLNDDEVPLPINRRRRVEQAAAILGVIAFEMYPRFSGVKLHSFQGAAAARAVEAGVASQATFERELLLLKEMNVHALDFLLFRESNEHRLAFRDRTTMAFFAAYWACRYEKPKKLEITRTWVVDDLFGMNQEHQEFWQFAAEMPDTGMPKNDRDETDESRWLALFAPLYDGSVKDDNGPIRSTEFIYRSWKRMEASPAGRRIIKEQYQAKTISQELLSGFIPLATGELPGDSGTFQMGDEFYARAVALQPFYLHQFCVPNTCYELFDPRHCVRRWVDNHSKSHRAVSELNDSAADDACPVVFVSWYDAVCFTKWLGNFIDNSGCYYKVTLPLEAQWEYACRAGRTTSYTFDELHLGATCTSDFCNFAGEDLDEYKYRGCTVPVDGSVPENWSAVLKIKPVKGPNRWGFY